MFVIGITGGTGTGKTTALETVRELGGEIIDCDEVYHGLLASDKALLAAIEAAFPGTVEDGVLLRKKLGQIVFGDEGKLLKLNGITHGFVKKEVERLLAEARRAGKTLAAVDAIALIEGGLGALCQATVAVCAPEETRVRRLMAREGVTEEYARLRIRAQKSEDWFRQHCTVTLVNDGSREEFAEKCRRCFEALPGEVQSMSMETMEKLESGVRSYSRAFPVEFTRAKMSRMYAADGRAYLDFFDGAGALNYGHNNDYIKERVLAYLADDGITHALDMFTGAKATFFEAFDRRILRPRKLSYRIMSCGPTGTNAVEAALKLARKVTGRTGIFALTGSFHGMTLGSLAVTSGVDHREGAHAPLFFTTFVPHPGAVGFDTIDYYEWLLTDNYSGVEKPAAFIIETTQAEGGVHVAPTEWLRRLRKLCDEQGVLLIVDDIQVGCARTGTYFSFERAGIVPDITVMSKSIGGYGMPFSLVLLKPELDLWLPGEHNGTFRGYQPSMVAAKAGIEVMLNDRAEERARRAGERIGAFMENELLPMDPRLAARGIGCIWGVDMAAFGPGKAKAVSRKCFENGLIIELAGRDNSVVKLMPQLLISDAELDEGLSILKAAVAAVIA